MNLESSVSLETECGKVKFTTSNMKVTDEDKMMAFCDNLNKENPELIRYLAKHIGVDGIGLFGLYLYFLKSRTKFRNFKLDEFLDFAQDTVG